MEKVIFSLIVCLSASFLTNAGKEPRTVDLSRKHVTVWFDYSVRYYDHEADNAYSKKDLQAMVNVASRRFSKICIDSAPVLDKLPPENEDHSRVWIPEVVARHNTQANRTSLPPMEVIVSFDVSKVLKTKQVTSFDVAKFMADGANEIYPGTVKTLMMYTGFTMFSAYYNLNETVQQLRIAREKLNKNHSEADSHFKYDLASFHDLKDCGHFKGPLGEKTKVFLPHVDTVVILIRPNYHQMTFTTEILHKMFVTKFEDCEKKLQDEKPSIRVVPAVLLTPRRGGAAAIAESWQKMSDWAKKKDREVILFEAFETPHGHLLSDKGWWSLKDKAVHDITEDSFVETVTLKGSKKGEEIKVTSAELSDETDNEASPVESHLLDATMTRSNDVAALYMIITLLSVVCLLLVAVNMGLVYGFRTMVVLDRRKAPPTRSFGRNSKLFYSQGLVDQQNADDMDERAVEISDSAPIVSFRK